MFKKVLQGVAIGAAMLSLAGPAAAVDYQINLYGASAQYLYWNDAADNFLTTVKGCDNVSQAQDSGKKNGISFGSNCPGPGGDTYTIRYSAKASFDGILSLKGDTSMTGTAEICTGGETICAPGTGTVPPADAAYYRKMSASVGSPSATCCARVTLGASDVAGESFIQESHGCLKGYDTSGSPNCTGDNWVDRTFTGIQTTGLSSANPLIVPFGFFANNCVTKTKCLNPTPLEGNPPLSGEPVLGTGNPPANPAGATSDWGNDKAISRWGHQCYDPDGDGKSADCVGYWKCVESKCVGGINKGNFCDQVTDCPDVELANTNCVRMPIDNISRLMAVLIYSGQVDDWQDFGLWWDGDCNPNEDYIADPSLRDPITACLRHAGSGTHATMDLAVMKGNGWGAGIFPFQLDFEPTQTNQPGYYGFWFNDGSSDLMACINKRAGAIGYADCDQLVGTKSGTSPTQQDFTYEFVHELKYNGVECRRAKIRNCEYDFWSTQWVYWDTNVLDAAAEALVGELIAFASNPANLPGSKVDYWASLGEMNCFKGSDTQYPGKTSPTFVVLP